jgi:uncharacterized protein (DUF952 family)
VRWLFHATPADAPAWAAARAGGVAFAPPSLAAEGFVHASYRSRVVESARLYLPKDVPIDVLQIDPRGLRYARVEVASTPRGPMPHIHGAIPADAIHAVLRLDQIDAAPEEVRGTRAAFLSVARRGVDALAASLAPVVAWDPTFTWVAVDPRTPGPDGALAPLATRARFDVVLTLRAEDLVPPSSGAGRTSWPPFDATEEAWLAGFPPNRVHAATNAAALAAWLLGE